MRTDDVIGVVHLPKDGQTNPVDTTQALARLARTTSAQIFENTKVTDIVVTAGRATGVRAAAGDIEAEFVVNAAGMWAHGLGAAAGTTVPLHAAEHFYIVTEPIPGLPERSCRSCATPTPAPISRRMPASCWSAGSSRSPSPGAWTASRETFSFETLPQDLEHIEPLLEGAIRRVPALATAGIQLFFNGPESFTPDNRYLLGETPEVRRLFVGAGFNSIGIQFGRRCGQGAGRLDRQRPPAHGPVGHRNSAMRRRPC